MMQAPSTTVWATDGNNYFEFAWSKAANATVSGTNPPMLQNVVARHLETVNTLFCDGHVKAMKLDSLTKTKSLPDPNNGNAATNIMTAFTMQDD